MEWWELSAWALALLTEFVLVYAAIASIVSVDVCTSHEARRYNESVKYGASAINTLSVGMIAGSVIIPLINGQALDVAWSGIWVFAGITLHVMGHLVLGLLKKEDGYG